MISLKKGLEMRVRRCWNCKLLQHCSAKMTFAQGCLSCSEHKFEPAVQKWPGQFRRCSKLEGAASVEDLGWTMISDKKYMWQREVILRDMPLVQAYEMVMAVKLGEAYEICHGTVKIGMVPYEELNLLVQIYGYSDLDDFVIQTSPTTEFVFKENGTIDREASESWILEYALLAQMDFESNCLEEYMTDTHFDSREQAEYFIAKNILKKEAAL